MGKTRRLLQKVTYHYLSKISTKLSNPLFLDDLHDEFLSIKTSSRNRKKNLLAFQDKLAAIKILDPACGSGNFLTESYLSLRRLENEILKELFGTQIQLGEFVNPIKVSINQFFGIEINDFAVAVAQKADMQKIFPKIKNLDYVAAWYKKAADFMRNSTCRAAFVATNSISQGETVTALWKNIFAAKNHILQCRL